ncbi:hypothetical protein ATSB10_07160 [Dyella thiooxydans]|uniref:Uncharacterized protein n=1 Tax=Dyella thiooxydans TaxID=445710 RepID=A0A160MY62_9GAMM|nr:hypothetical protein ATSB10_07160 [Dyella thiooxydans]
MQDLHNVLSPSWYKQRYHGNWFEDIGEPHVTPWLWRHRDPKASFQRGLNSNEYIRLDPQELVRVSDQYLNIPWLRHEYLDWVLVDAMMVNEVTEFGEEMKRQLWVNFSFFSIWAIESYKKHQGDLDKMLKDQALAKLQAWLTKAAIFIGIPLAIGFYVAKNPDTQISHHLAIGLLWYAGFFALSRIWWLLRYIAMRFKMRGQERNAKVKVLQLLEKMWSACSLMKGGAISARELRGALERAADAGTVWPIPIAPLVDRVIEQDGAVWTPLRRLSRQEIKGKTAHDW